ncbi:MAG TPA: AIM24 family protein [Blastocatellia bacterium]|nr:AIM24 family protein [Blastocatellia bacterium]
MTTIYNPNNLPVNDNINEYSFCMDVRKEMFIQKGKMIAYYGQLRFEALGSGMFEMLVGNAFNAPLYSRDFVIVTGMGKLILGDRGNNIASYDVEAANLTVRGDNLLAFESSLVCQESTVPGFLTLMGTGKILASSSGPAHFIEMDGSIPVRVDEDALLGWADLPCPSYRYDYAYVRNVLNLVGSVMGISSSGEERQLDFFGKGTVLLQSSEEGLKGRSNLQSIIAGVSGLHQQDLQHVATVIQQRLAGR